MKALHPSSPWAPSVGRLSSPARGCPPPPPVSLPTHSLSPPLSRMPPQGKHLSLVYLAPLRNVSDFRLNLLLILLYLLFYPNFLCSEDLILVCKGDGPEGSRVAPGSEVKPYSEAVLGGPPPAAGVPLCQGPAVHGIPVEGPPGSTWGKRGRGRELQTHPNRCLCFLRNVKVA